MAETGKVKTIETKLADSLIYLKIGDRPYVPALSNDGQWLFVTNQDDATVSVIETKSFNVIKTIDVGDKAEGIAMLPNGKQIYVVNWGG